MAKGARTVVELEREVALLKTRDARRAREVRQLRGDVDAIERMLAQPDPPWPATNSTAAPITRRDSAGTALRHRVRIFFSRWLP